MAKFNYSSNLKKLTANFDVVLDQAVVIQNMRRKALLAAINERILGLTPVWEGDTIANWRWFVGMPDMSYAPPIESPADPGHTGLPNPDYPLGQEPRRAANERTAYTTLLRVLEQDAITDIYLTNTSDSAVALEYGLLPTREKSRVDGSRGIVRLAIKEILTQYQ